MARALEVETARLGQPECYFVQLAREIERKRDEVAQVLTEVGLVPIIPDAGYFMMADTAPLGENSLGNCCVFDEILHVQVSSLILEMSHTTSSLQSG